MNLTDTDPKTHLPPKNHPNSYSFRVFFSNRVSFKHNELKWDWITLIRVSVYIKELDLDFEDQDKTRKWFLFYFRPQSKSDLFFGLGLFKKWANKPLVRFKTHKKITERWWASEVLILILDNYHDISLCF